MALRKNKTIDQGKWTLAQYKKEYSKLKEKMEKLELGAYCHMCDKFKGRDKFYVNSDILVNSGLSFICKECARKISERMDDKGNLYPPTKESLIKALRYLDKPFLEDLFNSSVQESENLMNGNVKENFARTYFKNVQMGQYRGKTFEDSDIFNERISREDEKTEEYLKENTDVGTYDQYIRDKKDVVRLLHYDPFENESVTDQPFLYSQLVGMLDSDENANDDMMRTSSIISIVRSFLQISKLDDAITRLMADFSNFERNASAIKSLQESKSKLQSIITGLASESCISLKNSKNAKKGEDSWTGKLRKIKDMNIREASVNGFDVGTCKGMQQVADISMKAIIQGLRFDESEYGEIISEQRQRIANLTKETSSYAEAVRILLKENIDLRDTLKEKNLLNDELLLDLDDVLNTYINGIEEE